MPKVATKTTIDASEPGRTVKTTEPDQVIERVAIDELEPHPDNPNHGDVEGIRESIRVNGWYGTVTIQKSRRRILVGEHRWRAAKAEGLTHIDVTVRDVDDVEAIRIMLVDNESAKKATIDEEVQDRLLETLIELDPEQGLAGTGYDLSAFEADVDEQAAEDEAAEAEEDDDGMFEPGEYDPDGVGVQYGILVMCESEQDQEATFKMLTTKARVAADRLRVVAV